MAITSCFSSSFAYSPTSICSLRRPSILHPPPFLLSIPSSPTLSNPRLSCSNRFPVVYAHSPLTCDGGNDDNNSGGGINENSDFGGYGGDENRKEAFFVMAAARRSLDSSPERFAEAIRAGRVVDAVVLIFLELAKSDVYRRFLRFPALIERLFADDWFLPELPMECGFRYLVKVAFAGTVYSISQRIVPLGLTGATLIFLVTALSWVGTLVANAWASMRKAISESPRNLCYGFSNHLLGGVERWIIESSQRGNPLGRFASNVAVQVVFANLRSWVRPRTNDTGKASTNALVQPTSPANVGTLDVDIVTLLGILLAMELVYDLGFKFIALASSCYDWLRQWLNRPRAST